jgi:hypothetical protein
MDGRRFPNRHDPPQIGEHTTEILREIGLSPAEIESLQEAGTIWMTGTPAIHACAESTGGPRVRG